MMKKTNLALTAVFVLAASAITLRAMQPDDGSETRTLPIKVQGVDYRSTLPSGSGQTVYVETLSKAPAANASTFSFDDIESWAGEGEKKAGLIIQWNCAGEETALVFGFRWDGDATGADLLKAVAKANPRLYTLMQYTNVSSPTDPNGGYTINGIGWDADDDGDISLIDTGHNNEVYKSADGFFEHPRGYVPGQGGSSDYDYDNWIAGDSGDFWQAGWYTNGFWSYWVGSSPTALGFSGLGASGRVLKDGDWDGWNFDVSFSQEDWKTLVAAPSSIPADAKTKFINEGICYTLRNYNNRTVEVSAPFEGAQAYAGEVIIPGQFVDGDDVYTVVGVGKEAFASSQVTSVILPTSATAIADGAFKDSKLADINITDNVKSIGKYAFMNCPLANIAFPTSISSVAEGAYSGTAITSLNIPAYVTSIADDAFAGCKSLQFVTLHKDIKTYGTEVFASCDALESVTVNSIYPPAITDGLFSEAAYASASLVIPMDVDALYKAADGWKNFTNLHTFPTEVTAKEVFPKNGVTYRVEPTDDNVPTVTVSYAKFDGKPTVSAIMNANKEMYQGEVEIPTSVTFQGKTYRVVALGDSCFYGAANMTSVTIPEGITELPQSVFAQCKGLVTVKLPSTLTKIAKRGFDNCSSLETLSFPAGITEIPQYTFNYCKALKRIEMASPITKLEMCAFYSCEALEEAPALAEGITEIPQATYQYCKSLKSVAIPASVTTLGNYVFKDCQALVIDFPENVTKMGADVFANCKSLTSMKVNEKLISLPNNTFSGCTNLTSVEIPANVTTFGNSVLSGTGLTEFEIPATVTKIGSSTFNNCKSLTSVSLPASISTIPQSTFQNCSSLATVNLKAAKGTTIDNNAFSGCSALRSIVFGQPLSRVAEGSVKLPEGLTKIGNSAFANCQKLTLDPVMPSTLTSIGNYAFQNMSSLDAIELPEGFKTFGTYCLSGTSVKEIVIPSSVTSVSSNVFNGLKSLNAYLLSDTPPAIYSTTFKISSSATAKVMVPSGMAAAYEAKSTYWKNAKPSEPELDVKFGKPETSYANEAVSLKVAHAAGYPAEAEHPARFIEANSDNLTKASVTFVYAEKDGDSTENGISALADAISSVAEATVADGHAEVSLTDLDPTKVYTGVWKYNLGQTAVESEPFEFAGSHPSSIGDVVMQSVDGIISYIDGTLIISGCKGQTVKVIALDGKEHLSAECDQDVATYAVDFPAGIYVVSLPGKAIKISVK